MVDRRSVGVVLLEATDMVWRLVDVVKRKSTDVVGRDQRRSLIKQNMGTVIDAQTVFSPHLQQHWCTRHS